MITSVNNLNAEEYRILFAKATQDLMNHKEDGSSNNGDYHYTGFGEEEVKEIRGNEFGVNSNPAYEKDTFFVLDEEQFVLATEENADSEKTYYQAPDISSLNAYFSYIEALAKIDEKYVVLPLTEDIFEINANTREITVPKHFKDNGISVQGDEISEILYFKIDRYFDAQDLNDREMNIYIQWRSSALDDNKQPVEGVSQAFWIDVETAPNYILFGWPISSEITKAAGEITFAVRFYKFNTITQHIDYSFSTLTQKVKIQPSLDFKIQNVIQHTDSNLILDDSTALVINRLVNSDYNDASVQAGEPYFIVNLNPFGAEVTPDPLTGDVELEFWLNRDNNFGESAVKVQANGDGKISYDWSYVTEKNPDTNISSTSIIPSTNVFYKTSDTERWDGSTPDKPVKTYYTINPDDPEADEIVQGGPYYGAGVVYTGTFDEEDENYPEYGIWERFSEAKIQAIGTYYVTVTNKVQSNRVRIRSYKLIVKRPATPTIINQLPTKIALPENGTQEVFVQANSEDKERSKFTYQWQVLDANSTSENEVWNNVSENSSENDHYTFTDSELGIYKVIVTNNLNRLAADIYGTGGEIATNSIESERIRVTKEASAPTYQKSRTNTSISAPESFEVIVSPDASETRTDEDQILVAWYKYNDDPSDQIDLQAELDAIEDGSYTRKEADREVQSELPLISLENENDGSKYHPTEETGTGTYFCVITNVYNGSQKSVVCGPFTCVS